MKDLYAIATNSSYNLKYNEQYRCMELDDDGVNYITVVGNGQCMIVPQSMFSDTKLITPDEKMSDDDFIFKTGDVLDVRTMFDKRGKYNHVHGRIKIVKAFKSGNTKLYSINTETYGPNVKITVVETQILPIVRDMSASVWKNKVIIGRINNGLRYVGSYTYDNAIKNAAKLLKNKLVKEAFIKEMRDADGNVQIAKNTSDMKVSLWIENPFRL